MFKYAGTNWLNDPANLDTKETAIVPTIYCPTNIELARFSAPSTQAGNYAY